MELLAVGGVSFAVGLSGALSLGPLTGRCDYDEVLTAGSGEVHAFDFVALAERPEAEGRRPRVVASY